MKGCLLDTNVLSELMRPQPDERVQAWFAGRSGGQYFISSITRAEILLGIALLPQGKRRAGLADAAHGMFDEDFRDCCLAFDANAADRYADLVAMRNRAGAPISVEDAQIAAVSLANGLPLVTRNEKDFAGIDDISIINPWSETQS
ncbi:MAG: type II toxin-antitoxin system VapC family toxin [Gallionellaceae bacterium]|nr:type II toxin-antitoxin system VapC family toxin [Gallionellaceae bacterium]MDD5363785.1 type II toxin-antitoxin system VapC family toxin [Gallionellaceae bacterium]